MEGSILSLASSDVWIVTAVEDFSKREAGGANLQKIYANTFGRDRTLAVERIVGQTRVFVE